jgi:hypothetical protein
MILSVNKIFNYNVYLFVFILISVHYFSQKIGVKISKTVYNSKRPISIIADKIHLAMSGIDANPPPTPIISVLMPVLLIHDKQ